MIENLIFPLDYIIITFGAIVVLFCFWRGIVKSILALLTWIGSIILSIYFYKDLANFIDSQLLNIDLFENYEQITGLLSIIISIPLIFLISLFILKKLRNILSSDLDKQTFGILIDKLFGFLFGFVLNYIIFSTLIYCTLNFEFLNFLHSWMLNNSSIILILDNFNSTLIEYITGNEIEVSN